jgi:putative ubiquitin-RnfH superfamily antitoxin RatB of RatAB toxin-antitoxin module
MTTLIEIEVVYADAGEQEVCALKVPAGTTLRQAVEAAGLGQRFPGLDPSRCRLGVFGRLRGADEPVQAGDRVEIYRPLQADPKQARRERARRKGQTPG